MATHTKNPGLAPRASLRNQLRRWLHKPSTSNERRAQMIATRFNLSPWLARDVAQLCFGEGRND